MLADWEQDKLVKHTWQGSDTELAVKIWSPTDNDTAGEGMPGFVWLGGFRSDMAGTKAERMVIAARQLGTSSLRFDYSGHGDSGGEFVDGTISRWVDESLTVIRSCTKGPQILVGSSMGGWITLRVAQELARLQEEDRLAGMLLIAPAPDFTRDLMEAGFSDEQRKDLQSQGYIEEPSEYSPDPNIITRQLIEDGRENLVLDKALSFGVPIHILQGVEDPDVPWQHAMKLVHALNDDNVSMTLVKNGDHRLSREEDLNLLVRTMRNLFESV